MDESRPVSEPSRALSPSSPPSAISGVLVGSIVFIHIVCACVGVFMLKGDSVFKRQARPIFMPELQMNAAHCTTSSCSSGACSTAAENRSDALPSYHTADEQQNAGGPGAD